MSKEARILIVDDDEALCRTMALILERKGYTIATAKNGAEAIKQVEQQPFEAILMDIKMPVMDGVQAYKKIKQIRPEAVVIMMTAYALEDLVQDALQEGAFAVLNKPLDMEEVLAVIAKATMANSGGFIMVVDDDENTCKTLEMILKRRHHRVITALTGEEAINLARQQKYDLYLIDMKLPALNGLETHLAIRELHPQAITICMTAYRQDMAQQVRKMLSKNAYTCLYKPLDIEHLLRLLDEIMEMLKN